jgi:hypothetical protein
MNIKFTRFKKTAFLLISVSFSLPNIVYAQNDAQTPLEPLYQCASHKDDSQRLKCYDEIVASVKIKEEKAELVTIDAPKMQQLKKEAFGFSMPSFGKMKIIKENDAKDEAEKVALVATKFDDGSNPKIYFENGQIWQVIDGESIVYFKKMPANAVIQRASFGSFILSLNGSNKGYRVKRVE